MLVLLLGQQFVAASAHIMSKLLAFTFDMALISAQNTRLLRGRLLGQ